MNFSHEVKKSFATIREMLTDRGVDVSSLNAISGDDLLAIAGARTVFHVDLESCKHRIVYNMNARFKLVDIRKLLEDEGPTTFIVVSNDKPTHPGRKGLDELNKDVEFFHISELQYNVSRHTLVPRHEKMRDEAEIEELLASRYLKTKTHLPLIQSTDPMARYLALKPGDVVKITRASPSAGTAVYYRCCARAT